jgi:hypothetical protein
MKLAIIGHSPLALEAAIRFHLHGAALTWYIDQDDLTLFNCSHLPADAFVSDLGMGLLKEMNLTYSPAAFSWNEWTEKYEKPIIDYLRVHQEVRNDDVISVSKRFLAPGEVISGRSRFLDLFRIIYRVNPREFIEEQKEVNPETYKKLTEEFISSLTSTIEMYQDYDLVLDFRSDLSRSSAAASGKALGESRVTDKVSYSMGALKKSHEMISSPTLRDIAIIGSDSLAAEILLSLSTWLQDQRSNLFIVTTEDEPFKDFFSKATPRVAEKLMTLINQLEEEFQQEIEGFTKKLRDWQELDDFVQVKVPRPAEPIPRLNFFSGHNVTAIDELIDRKRMFLTLEKPEFRHGKKHPENNNVELKTLGVDHILIAHAKKDRSIVEVDQNEQGFFDVTPTRVNLKDSWEKDLLIIEGIEDEIFKLFSPVSSH